MGINAACGFTAENLHFHLQKDLLGGVGGAGNKVLPKMC